MFYPGGVEPRLQQRVGDPAHFAAMQRQPPSLPPKCASLPPYAECCLETELTLPSSLSVTPPPSPPPPPPPHPTPLVASLPPLSGSLPLLPAEVSWNEDLTQGWLLMTEG